LPATKPHNKLDYSRFDKLELSDEEDDRAHSTPDVFPARHCLPSAVFAACTFLLEPVLPNDPSAQARHEQLKALLSVQDSLKAIERDRTERRKQWGWDEETLRREAAADVHDGD
jgi:hypothetical protein